MYEDVWGMIMSHAGPQRNLQYQIKTNPDTLFLTEPPVSCFLFIVLDVHRDEDGVTSLRPKHWGLQPRNLVTEPNDPRLSSNQTEKNWHGSLLV